MRTWIKVWINKVEADVSGYLKRASYREAIDGEADTLELTLQDAPGLFTSSWFPPRGASIELTVVSEYEAMPLGEFIIDEIENTLPPGECRVKGTSIPPGSAAKSVDKWRSWESVPLSRIARDVAEGAGLTLFYDASDDPEVARAEQASTSDLKFLHKICADRGLALKLNDQQLIIFDFEEYERRDVALKLRRGESEIKRFQARTTLNEVYGSCVVSYKHGKRGEEIEGSYAASEGLSGLVGGKTLRINQKVASQGEAERLARRKLREKNREEISVHVTTIGDFRLRAGNTLSLEGFNIFDGKYLIKEARHEMGDGYTTSVELTKCLEG